MYGLALYLGLATSLYFLFGFQYEYISALFHMHYQSIDFCFKESTWQWGVFGQINNEWAFFLREQAVNLTWDNEWVTGQRDSRSLLHPAGSWNFAGLPILMYFNPVSVDFAFFLSYALYGLLAVFFLAQTYAFLLPGQLVESRQRRLLELNICLWHITISPLCLLLTTAVLVELSIEPLDSELIFMHQSIVM